MPILFPTTYSVQMLNNSDSDQQCKTVSTAFENYYNRQVANSQVKDDRTKVLAASTIFFFVDYSFLDSSISCILHVRKCGKCE